MLVAIGAILAGCGGSAGIGGSTYAGDIEPTVGRAPRDELPALPSYAALPSADGTAPTDIRTEIDPADGAQDELSPASSDGDAAPPSAGPAAPTPVATTTPIPTSTAAAATPVARPVVSAPAPVASAPRQEPPPPAPSPSVSSPPPPSAPPPTNETAGQATGDEPVRVVPDPSSREPRPETFPNLADVPDDPGNLPSNEETAAVRAELEADRDAINQGETPPSVSDGSILGSVRERLRASVSTPAPGGTTSVAFDSGTSSLSLSALATLQTVAMTQIETGAGIRLVGYAYASSEANRQAALGIALDRANTVASALVSYGADPSSISIFASALTDVSQQNAASSRRVDITFQ